MNVFTLYFTVSYLIVDNNFEDDKNVSYFAEYFIKPRIDLLNFVANLLVKFLHNVDLKYS